MPTLRLGRPVWLDRSPHHRRRRYPSLKGNVDVDVAIVGGGITGAAIASRFSEAGVRVGLVDAALVGHGSTAASTALLMQEPDQGVTELAARYGSAAARRIWTLSQEAARDFIATLKRLGIRCGLAERDSVYCTEDLEAVEPLRREYRRRRRAGFGGTWLDADDLQRTVGISGLAAIKTSGNAQLDPYKACVGLLDRAAHSGARIFERSRVRRIERPRHGVEVVTASGTLTAQRVLIATGYATPEFQPLVGRFRMNQTFAIATSRIDARRRRSGLADVMLWDTRRSYHYVRWTDDRRLLLGGGDRHSTSARQRATAFRDRTRDLREYFEPRIPAIADAGIEYAWEGLFAVTPDGLPFIGPHRRYPRHLFALGYGGNGMTFSFLAARLLLECCQGVQSPDHRFFAFSRFR